MSLFLLCTLLLVHGLRVPSKLPKITPRKRVEEIGPAAQLDLKQFINQTVIFSGGHPGDIEAFGSGLGALLRKQGTTVYHLVTVNGDKGWGKDTQMTSEMLGAIRRNESIAAAAVLNMSSDKVLWMGYPDGFINNIPEGEARERITVEIRRLQPYAVFTHYPKLGLSQMGWRLGTEHVDHYTTGHLTLLAVAPTAGCYLAYPQLSELGLPIWWTPTIYFYNFELNEENTFYVDITPVMDTKMQSFACHQSQYNSTQEANNYIQAIGSYVASNSGTGYKYLEGYLRLQFGEISESES